MASNAGASSSTKPGGQPKPPVVVPGTGNNIIINPCQRGNPILECVKNVGKEYGDILADYQVGSTTGVLFLRLHPEYIHQRIEKLGRAYNLRILLLMCDVSEHQEPIRELTKICLINEITVMVAWKAEEAGHYLSTYKQFEHKPPDLIKERVDKDYHSVLRTALTSISKVNKTDVETLRTSFGSFARIAKASSEQLQNLPGFGQVKARRIQDAFNKPFRNKGTTALTALQVRASQIDPSSAGQEPPSYADKGKGRATEFDLLVGNPIPDTGARAAPGQAQRAPMPPRPPPAPRARSPSPTWDMELDLNDTPDPDTRPEPEPEPDAASTITPAAVARKRPPSPVWDLELDLNPSEDEDVHVGDGDVREVPRGRKRPREGSGSGSDLADFGAPAMLAGT